jgi:hypothetical protein
MEVARVVNLAVIADDQEADTAGFRLTDEHRYLICPAGPDMRHAVARCCIQEPRRQSVVDPQMTSPVKKADSPL